MSPFWKAGFVSAHHAGVTEIADPIPQRGGDRHQHQDAGGQVAEHRLYG
jgi:hypothetical protein